MKSNGLLLVAVLFTGLQAVTILAGCAHSNGDSPGVPTADPRGRASQFEGCKDQCLSGDANCLRLVDHASSDIQDLRAFHNVSANAPVASKTEAAMIRSGTLRVDTIGMSIYSADRIEFERDTNKDLTINITPDSGSMFVKFDDNDAQNDFGGQIKQIQFDGDSPIFTLGSAGLPNHCISIKLEP